MGVDDQDIIEFVGATVCAAAAAELMPEMGLDGPYLVTTAVVVAKAYAAADCVRTPEIDSLMEEVSLHLSTPEGRMN